jgi:hypothetical protein
MKSTVGGGTAVEKLLSGGKIKQVGNLCKGFIKYAKNNMER